MPELPEVETTRRGIAPHLEHAIPTQIRVRQPQLRWPVEIASFEHWCGAPITRVQRRGKYLILTNTNGHVLIHLGMSGSLRILLANTQPHKHDHIDLVLHNGKILRYTDPRRFGAWLFWDEPDPLTHPLLAKLGPEPLSDTFNSAYLYARTQKSRRAIKTLIMDSRTIVGAGNIYANEALFQAGIHPSQPAHTLNTQQIKTLTTAIKTILAQAVELGGTTLQDFTQPDGKPGYFAQTLQVYGKTGKPCPTCGHTIEQITLGQRSSYFCPICQAYNKAHD